MNEILARGGRVEDTTDEKARRAVANFRRMQPTLSAYVRNLTGNPKARVDMAAQDNGSTDGERVYIRPPLALGENVTHVRRYCDQRDADGAPVCPACAAREDVLVRVYHEIAHIAFGSFQSIADDDKKRAIIAAIKETGGKYAPEIAARIESARIKTYRELTAYVNEYLPFLINALEDARVDLQMFKARPGTRIMREADVKRIFREGVEVRNDDGLIETKHWSEAPLNTQVMVGTLVKIMGYNYRTWFHPDVVEALGDEQLTELLRSMHTLRSAREVYYLSFKVLARLRELGFCGTEEDPDPEPQPDPEPEDESDEQQSDNSPEQSDEDADEREGSAPDPDAVPEEPEPEDSSEGSGESESNDEGDMEPGEGSDPGEDGEASSGDDQPSDSDSEPSDEAGDGGSDRDNSEREGDSDSDGDGDGEGDRESDGEGSGSESDAGESSDGEPRGSGADELDSDSASGADGESTDSDPEDGEVDEDSSGTSGSSSSDDAERSDDTDSEGGSQGGSVSSESSEHGEPEDAGDADSGMDESSDVRHDDEPGDSSSPLEGGDERSCSGSDLGDEPNSSSGDDSSSTGGDAAPDGMDLDDDAFRSDDRRDKLAPGELSGTDEDVPGSDSEAFSDDDSEAASDGGLLGQGDIHAGDSDADVLDTGADDGYGGTSVKTGADQESAPVPEFGEPEDVELALLKWGDHEEKPKTMDATEASAVDKAIVQGIYFTTPSSNIFGVKEFRYGDGTDDDSGAWSDYRQELHNRRVGKDTSLDVPEQILQPALGQMRRAFTDNRRGMHERNRKSGRVDARSLGKRAPVHDPRLFKKNSQPGKKDYFVVIGMDLSYSTVGVNLALEKRAVMAQAELLDRVGIPFAIYGHSGRGHEDGEVYLDIYHIKDARESWSGEPKRRLAELGPVSANLDGHAMEFLRKRLEESNATDKILLYYSDGKMPAENHDEELDILTREIHLCRAKNYTLLGVGIRTDSPSRHGLETVEVHEDEDLVKVVQQLGKRLAKK